MRHPQMSFVFFGLLVAPALAQSQTGPQGGPERSPNMAPHHETIPDRVRIRDMSGSGFMNVRSGLADHPQEPTVRLRPRDDTRKR
jgi:hypothetical protein